MDSNGLVFCLYIYTLEGPSHQTLQSSNRKGAEQTISKISTNNNSMKKIETTLFRIPCKIKGICNVFSTVARLNKLILQRVLFSNIWGLMALQSTTVHARGLCSLKLGGNFKHPKKRYFRESWSSYLSSLIVGIESQIRMIPVSPNSKSLLKLNIKR